MDRTGPKKYRERGFASEDRAAPVTATVPARRELGFKAMTPLRRRKAPRRESSDRAPASGRSSSMAQPSKNFGICLAFLRFLSIFCDIF